MSLHPSVARTLYKALRTAGRLLQSELHRYDALRSREMDLLRAAAAAPLPKELRGLLDVCDDAWSTRAHAHLLDYISVCARRIAEAASTPQLASLEAAVGFAALRHLNRRVDALRQLVYDTSSDAERHGIKVGVESMYQGADRDRYFFRYQVRIRNSSSATVQLLSRAWTIRDLDGRVTSVQGPGVVGAFPTLAPKQTYEYSSAVPLHTPLGTQSGHYIFVLHGAPRQLAKTLQVPVAPFSHRTPNMVADAAAAAAAPTAKTGRVRRRRLDDSRRR